MGFACCSLLLFQQGRQVIRAVVLKLGCASESPGGLFTADRWASPPGVWSTRSRVGPENLHFCQVPRWAGDPSLRTTEFLLNNHPPPLVLGDVADRRLCALSASTVVSRSCNSSRPVRNSFLDWALEFWSSSLKTCCRKYRASGFSTPSCGYRSS